MSWSDLDLELKFLLAKPIEMGGIGQLYPLTLNKIAQIGIENYNKYMGVLCISKEEIEEMVKVSVEPFEFIYQNAVYNEEFQQQIINALSLFLHEDINMVSEGFSVGDSGLIHVSNFNFFIEILMMQNCIKSKDSNEKYPNDKVKEYMQRIKALKEKYQKNYGGGGVDITDIISSVSAKHPSLNLLNVGEMTIYQVYDQYKRLNKIDEYEISLNSLMHGAAKEDVQLSHWSSKIDEK